MEQLVYRKGVAVELDLFPYIMEAGTRKNSAIQLRAFHVTASDFFRIYFVHEGKFEWLIGDKSVTAFPGDTLFISPGLPFGHVESVLEIGSFSWLYLRTNFNGEETAQFAMSRLLMHERSEIIGSLTANMFDGLVKMDAGKIIRKILQELRLQEAGYESAVHSLVDELLTRICRTLTQQNIYRQDFTQDFTELENRLRNDLSHQWSLDEMAAIVGMGTTAFNDKVKSFSGFTPINYLINIRISEAIKMLRQTDLSITDIALETGFYSSQHFATTFKKLTGFTPSQYKRNH